MLKTFQNGVVAVRNGVVAFRVMPRVSGSKKGWVLELPLEGGKWEQDIWEPELETLLVYAARNVGASYQEMLRKEELMVA